MWKSPWIESCVYRTREMRVKSAKQEKKTHTHTTIGSTILWSTEFIAGVCRIFQFAVIVFCAIFQTVIDLKFNRSVVNHNLRCKTNSEDVIVHLVTKFALISPYFMLWVWKVLLSISWMEQTKVVFNETPCLHRTMQVLSIQQNSSQQWNATFD